MTTEHAACTAAQSRARRTRAWTYVVFSDEETGAYHVAREHELDDYFAGALIVAVFGPDGTREAN